MVTKWTYRNKGVLWSEREFSILTVKKKSGDGKGKPAKSHQSLDRDRLQLQQKVQKGKHHALNFPNRRQKQSHLLSTGKAGLVTGLYNRGLTKGTTGVGEHVLPQALNSQQ